MHDGLRQPVGSLYNRVRAEAIDAWHGYRNHHSEWFALFSDKTKRDGIRVNGLNRTGFRLHPLNSDGSGESWGCITLRRSSDIQHLRRLLLQRGTFPVPGGNGLKAYPPSMCVALRTTACVIKKRKKEKRLRNVVHSRL
ncbi:tlde1 domain-containing protein [Pantoea sp. AS142]|uniref:tlde1 domain-containing protein n=1 Tax=Pantoea sp. AS142 TaxID=3081292 RepID=UPI003FA7E189